MTTFAPTLASASSASGEPGAACAPAKRPVILVAPRWQEMERTLEKLLPWLEAEGVYLLNEYLEVYRRYARRSSRYYFYRGSLYGAREALEIWAEEHGGSGGALA